MRTYTQPHGQDASPISINYVPRCDGGYKGGLNLKVN